MSKRQQLRTQEELKILINARDNKNECAECKAPFPSMYITWITHYDNIQGVNFKLTFYN